MYCSTHVGSRRLEILRSNQGASRLSRSNLVGFTVVTMANIAVYKPTRILSADSASELTFWIRQKLDEGMQHLIVDLKNVMFMDSSGLGSLVAARRMTHEHGAKFVLTSLNGQAQMLFDLAGVQDLFLVFPTIESYRNSLPEEVSL